MLGLPAIDAVSGSSPEKTWDNTVSLVEKGGASIITFEKMSRAGPDPDKPRRLARSLYIYPVSEYILYISPMMSPERISVDHRSDLHDVNQSGSKRDWSRACGTKPWFNSPSGICLASTKIQVI